MPDTNWKPMINIVKRSINRDINRIADLHTNLHGWLIKVRVTKKGDPFEFRSAWGAGKLLNVELIDEFGDQIVCTFFNNDVVDWFNKMIEVGKCYLFSNGSIKPANKKYTSIKNDY